MAARRYRALHFGNMEGKNVVYHREHRSKHGRQPLKRRLPYLGDRNSKAGKRWRHGLSGM